jgi:hypothetical protein
MKPIDKVNLYKDAIKTWGILAQLNMVVEECSELIKAVQKAKRVHTSKEIAMREMLIAYETVDVEIMCEQLRQIFKSQPFDKMKEQKLERLKKRLGV